jgi:glucose-1-phosphate thymidylyltransferase
VVDQGRDPVSQQQVIGLIPAAGQATRLAPLPMSKELYPIGFRPVDDGRSVRPKVVCHYLLEKMRWAGIRKAYIVLRAGKWDIPAYFGDGSMLDMHLAYLIVHCPFGAPYTLDQVYPFVGNACVAIGLPDILFQPADAFVSLLARQAATHAEVVLGLFPIAPQQKADMVAVDGDGRVRQIVIKPAHTHLRYAWIIAVWTPAFARFMHDYLASQPTATDMEGHSAPAPPELFIGNVLQAAIDQDIRVEAVCFPDGSFLDIGIPDNLVTAVQTLAAPISPSQVMASNQ